MTGRHEPLISVTMPDPRVGYQHCNAFMPPRLTQRGYEQAEVAVVEKNFAPLQESPLYGLRPEALGTAYWNAAWNWLPLGNCGVWSIGAHSLAGYRVSPPAPTARP